MSTARRQADIGDNTRKVYQRIFAILLKEGRRPSMAEINAYMGFTAMGTHYHLNALERHGYIRRTRKKHRRGNTPAAYRFLKAPDGTPFRGLALAGEAP